VVLAAQWAHSASVLVKAQAAVPKVQAIATLWAAAFLPCTRLALPASTTAQAVRLRASSIRSRCWRAAQVSAAGSSRTRNSRPTTCCRCSAVLRRRALSSSNSNSKRALFPLALRAMRYREVQHEVAAAQVLVVHAVARILVAVEALEVAAVQLQLQREARHVVALAVASAGRAT